LDAATTTTIIIIIIIIITDEGMVLKITGICWRNIKRVLQFFGLIGKSVTSRIRSSDDH
jgi:hypothetical protein